MIERWETIARVIAVGLLLLAVLFAFMQIGAFMHDPAPMPPQPYGLQHARVDYTIIVPGVSAANIGQYPIADPAEPPDIWTR